MRSRKAAMADREMAWFLLQQDTAFLLALRKMEAIPFAGQWTLPGDAVRQHESASHAIARIGRDEMDIDVLGDELIDTLTLVEGGDNYAAGIYRIGFEGHPRFRGGGPYQQVG